MIEQVIVLGCQLVYSVNVERRDPVLFINRQVKRLAVNLPRARKYYLHMRIVVTARFEQCELRGAVEFEIPERIEHGLEVRDVAGEIENEIHATDEVIDDKVVSHVGLVDSHVAFKLVDVETISPLIG